MTEGAAGTLQQGKAPTAAATAAAAVAAVAAAAAAAAGMNQLHIQGNQQKAYCEK
jgi:hypothetical protein